MLQLRMDQWKVAVNPQVQKAAEAAERSRVVPGVEIADDYEPSREEVAHHWGMSVEKVAWAELWEEDSIMSLRRCWLRVSHASGAPDHMLERPRDELETTAMKRFPAVNPSPSSVAPEPRVDVDFLGPRGQSTQRAQQGRAPSLFCPALPCFGRRSGLPCPALPYRSFPLWLSCPALPCFFLPAFAFSFAQVGCRQRCDCEGRRPQHHATAVLHHGVLCRRGHPEEVPTALRLFQESPLEPNDRSAGVVQGNWGVVLGF